MRPDERAYLATLRALSADTPATALLEGLEARLHGRDSAAATGVPPPPEGADAGLLGRAREALLSAEQRRTRGAHYTPPHVCEALLHAALVRLGAHPDTVTSVCDPAAGGGAFLLAAHRRLPRARLLAIEADRLTADVCRRSLRLAGATDVDVTEGDGLLQRPQGLPAEGVDLVLGNPPFLSQLNRSTARTPARRRALERRFGGAARGYVDEAALFLLVAVDLLRPGGVAVLIVPESVLAARDAVTARAAVAARATVEVVWRDDDRVFHGVPTCAVALTRAPENDPTRGTSTWAPLLTRGVPEEAADARTAGTLGDIAAASADFRDAYYLVADHVAEASGPDPAAGPAENEVPILTVGLIDPADPRWGVAPARFAKRRWTRPVATGLPQAFLAPRVAPKVLLATQTRALEAVVDDAGRWLPTTPVITLRGEDLWRIGAVLTNPVTSAWALRHHAGAARSRDAVKLSARQALAAPLPADCAAWDVAGGHLRRAHADATQRARHLWRCGAAMVRAYGCTAEAEPLMAWWWQRLPSRSAGSDPALAAADVRGSIP